MTRIVSLLPAATEMVCGIGLREQLVGVSHECNWPPGLKGLPRVTRSRIDSAADSAVIDAQVKQFSAAGEAMYEVDAELLAALRPTLIVTQAQCDVCAVSLASVEGVVAARSELRETRVLALNPRSLGEVLDDIERIGAAAGTADAARAYAESLRVRVDVVRAAASNDEVGRAKLLLSRGVGDGAEAAWREPRPPLEPRPSGERRPRVAVIEWVEPLMAAGNWTPELVELAGGDYGLATVGEPSPYVEWRQIVEFAPEVLVVAPCGFDLARSEREAARLEQLPCWFDLPAVAQQNASVIDGDAYLNRPGPRLVESLELLYRLIRRARRA